MSYAEQALAYMKEHGSITSWEAIQAHHNTRLSESILLLRNQGYKIDTLWETKNGKRYGRYVLMDALYGVDE